MLKQILRQDNHTWKAQRYYVRLKKTVPAFDYQIYMDKRIDEQDIILWIMPFMRNVVKLYPEILSLDI